MKTINPTILLILAIITNPAWSDSSVEYLLHGTRERLGDLKAIGDDPTKAICPLPDLTPESIAIDKDDPDEEFKDHDRDIKNVGTDFVVEQFFSTPETLYSFLSLVYRSVDDALKTYREEKGLEERAVFLLFKGGNVLRMVANTVFGQLPEDAKKFLMDEYVAHFKRGDADFSVYLDALKLGSHTYDKTLSEVTTLLFEELGKIRATFEANPQKYFYMGPKRQDIASTRMSQFFDKLNGLEAVAKLDKDGQPNKTWYNAQFHQFQLLNERAKAWPRCTYVGGYDARYEAIADKVITTRLSSKTNWIVNTDNRNLGWTWGSDPSKQVKFFLVRSKAYFEYTFEKDGALKRKAVGGELIDISIPHRDDDRLRDFLDNYDVNVAEYTIIKDHDDWLTMKAYSLLDLAEDLQFILLDSFDRPWKGGAKYNKRIYRLFFLFIAEQLGAFGLGSAQTTEYIANIRENIIQPLNALFPLNENASAIAAQVQSDIQSLGEKWSQLPLANHFWHAFGNFIENALVPKPQDGDQAGFQEMISHIVRNLDFTERLGTMTPTPIDLDRIHRVNLKDLF